MTADHEGRVEPEGDTEFVEFAEELAALVRSALDALERWSSAARKQW